MEKLALGIGLLFLGGAIACLVAFGWNGNWAAVGTAALFGFGGRLALGAFELVLSPLSIALLAAARRAPTVITTLMAVIFAIVQRTGFAVFCAVCLTYFLRADGAPGWLAVVLSAILAAAPFGWAGQQSTEEGDPRGLDTLAALLGTGVSGALFLYGVTSPYHLIPLVILYLLSAMVFVIWFVAAKAPRLRLLGLLGQ